MEMLVILTLAKPLGSGMQQVTLTQKVTVEPHTTRTDLLVWAKNQLPAEQRTGNIVFFSAEPNALPAQLKAVKA